MRQLAIKNPKAKTEDKFLAIQFTHFPEMNHLDDLDLPVKGTQSVKNYSTQKVKKQPTVQKRHNYL